MDHKQLSWPSSGRQVKKIQGAGGTVVFTNGCFDLLHAGHVELLESAAGMGDFLIVGVNSDASVSRLKGPGRPVTPLEDRIYILSALEAVNAIVVFPDETSPAEPELVDTPHELLQYLRPDILVKGGDYSTEDVIGREFAREIRIVKLREGRSSTALLERLMWEKTL